MKKTNKHFKASQGKITVNCNKSQYFYNPNIDKLSVFFSVILTKLKPMGKPRFLQKNVLFFFFLANKCCM